MYKRQDLYKGKTIEEMREKIIGILEGHLPDLTQAGYQVAKERDIAKIGQELDVYKRQAEMVLTVSCDESDLPDTVKKYL